MITAKTTKEIADQFIANLEAKISQTIPFLPRSGARVFARTLAGGYVLLHKYAAWQYLQLFISTASYEETTVLGKTFRPLVERCRERGAGDPKVATAAELVINVTVENQTGQLARNTSYLREPTGIIYLVKDPVDLDAATVQATVVASSDQEEGDGTGSIGNLQPGDELKLVTPNANVSSLATVASIAVAGADDEDPEVYRARGLRISQRKPQGGALADYQAWGEEVEGILNVYPYPGTRPNQMVVYVEATQESSGSEDGIPLQAQLDAVLANINLDASTGLASQRPTGASVTAEPISRKTYDLTVTGLAVDDETTVKNQIEDAVKEYLLDREPYIGGLTPTRKNRVTRDALGGVVASVVEAAGGTVTGVTLYDGPSPIVSDTLGDGQKAKLGAVSYD